MKPRWGALRGRGRREPGHTPGSHDRAALGAAMRGLGDAPDLAGAATVIAAHASRLLYAQHAAVVATEDGVARAICEVGADVGAPERAVVVEGALAAALLGARRGEVRVRGTAEVAAPVAVGGRPWGAILLRGPSTQVPRDARERLGPFADLLALAVATFEDRARLASLAGTDPLTGLGNRRAFDALLAAEAERAARRDDPLSLVLMDIDHFKLVNDRHGHQLGDRVLREVGRRLVAITRRGEAIMRIGGEEFAWVLPGSTADGAEAAAARALAAISATPFAGVGRLTVSAGVCDLGAASGSEDMVLLADRMLYRAKAGGRDTIRRFTPDADLRLSGAA